VQVQLTNALISMRRLTAYFMLEERDDYIQHTEEPGELEAGRRAEARLFLAL
jgi:hypothetical protein